VILHLQEHLFHAALAGSNGYNREDRLRGHKQYAAHTVAMTRLAAAHHKTVSAIVSMGAPSLSLFCKTKRFS
jgi:hypothetical protein